MQMLLLLLVQELLRTLVLIGLTKLIVKNGTLMVGVLGLLDMIVLYIMVTNECVSDKVAVHTILLLVVVSEMSLAVIQLLAVLGLTILNLVLDLMNIHVV